MKEVEIMVENKDFQYSMGELNISKNLPSASMENGERSEMASGERNSEDQIGKAPATPSPPGDHRSRAVTFFTYANVASFAIIGCLIRIGLEELLGPSLLNVENSETVLFQSFFSNMLGSLLLGLLVGLSLKELPGMKPVYIGLSTGMCGSITTFSKFNQQTSEMIIGEANTIGDPYFIAFAAIVLGIAAPISSFEFGLDISTEVRKLMPPVKGTDFRMPHHYAAAKVINYLSAIFLVLSWVTCLVISIVYSNRHQFIFVCLSAVMAPFGGLLRFLLSKLNNHPTIYLPTSCLKPFPLGTFLANFIGSVIMASAHVALTWASILCPWIAVLKAVQTGFCACLSTVSTLMSEISAMRSKGEILASHCYPLLTILLCELVTCIINGVSYGEYNNNTIQSQNITCP